MNYSTYIVIHLLPLVVSDAAKKLLPSTSADPLADEIDAVFAKEREYDRERHELGVVREKLGLVNSFAVQEAGSAFEGLRQRVGPSQILIERETQDISALAAHSRAPPVRLATRRSVVPDRASLGRPEESCDTHCTPASVVYRQAQRA